MVEIKAMARDFLRPRFCKNLSQNTKVKIRPRKYAELSKPMEDYKVEALTLCEV